MKYIFITILLIIASHLSAQVQTEEKISTKVEVEASFPGGQSAWAKFLKRNLNTKVPSDKGAPNGNYSTIVQFVVDKEGNVGDVKALTSHGYGMEEEAIRILKISGKWVPAQQNGRNVSSYHRQSITFVIQE